MYILNNYPTCPCCNGTLKEDIHHCILFTNGYPDTGYNHMKNILDFEEFDWWFTGERQYNSKDTDRHHYL